MVFENLIGLEPEDLEGEDGGLGLGGLGEEGKGGNVMANVTIRLGPTSEQSTGQVSVF